MAPPLVPLSEVAAHLGKTTDAGSSELAMMVEVATLCAEEFVGRSLRPQEITATVSGDDKPAILLRPPIVSIAAVTIDGVALAPNGYCRDSAAGILYRGAAPGAATWPRGADNITITYTSGPQQPSPIAVHAVKELTRHLWETQRGGPNREIRGDDWTSTLGYSIPNRVLQLLGALSPVSGIA